MPEYDYLCDDCGPFTEIRPMAQYASPQPCPGCGEASPRALLAMPALGMMDAGQRKAFATNERSAHAPKVSQKHARGCSCCSGPSVSKATAAAKGFPQKRPWMISH